MGKAIVTLSFDDGRKDTYDVFSKILKPMNIPATVNIPTGYIETGYSDPKEVGYNGLMSKKELDELYKCELFEIAGHGYMHKNDNEDIKTGIERLKNWYPMQKTFGFASPHSLLSSSVVYQKREYYESLNIEYVRLGRNFSRLNYYRRALSKIASLTGSVKAFLACYKDSLNTTDSFILHAVPVIKTTTVEQIKAIIDFAISESKWLILEIHGVDRIDSKEYQELFCTDIEKFKEIVAYINNLKSGEKLSIMNAIDIKNSSKFP